MECDRDLERTGDRDAERDRHGDSRPTDAGDGGLLDLEDFEDDREHGGEGDLETESEGE